MDLSTSQNGTTHRPLRHDGYCGRRIECWRQACRDTFAGYATVELRPSGAVAFCHRTISSVFDIKVDIWCEGQRP